MSILQTAAICTQVDVLTDAGILNLPRRDKEYQIDIEEIFIDEAIEARLQLRVRENGTKAYILRYAGHYAARRRYETIGSVRKYTLEAAKQAAQQIIASMHYGDKKTKIPSGRKNVTFGAAFDQYGHKPGDTSSKWEKTASNHIRKLVLPKLAECQLRSISRTKLLEIVQHNWTINHSRGRNLLASLRAFLSWCADQGFIDENPLWRVTLPPSIPRCQKFLSVEELAGIYVAAEKLGAPWYPMIAIALATGETMEDIRQIQAEHLDLARSEWFQYHLTDSYDWGRPENLRVYLSEMALVPLRGVSRGAGYMFASPRVPKQKGFHWTAPVSSPVYFRQSVVLELRKVSGVKGKWGLRDLRDSVSSHLNRTSKTDKLRMDQWSDELKHAIEYVRTGIRPVVEEEEVVL